MGRLLTWHTRLGRFGLRMLWLHLLWIGWTLRGGVVLGIFPATAALHGVLRDDERTRSLVPGDDPDLGALRTRFREIRQRERRSANRLGALLVALWAIVLLDRAVVGGLDLGPLGPSLAGAHTVVGIVLGAITILVWPLQAHFDDTAPALLRRSAVVLLGRPGAAILAVLGVGIVLYLYLLVPGLIPVFGVVAPAVIATASLWRTGTLVAAGIGDSTTTHAPTEPGGLVARSG